MMYIVINESGLHFGPFAKGKCFHIENSKLFSDLGERIKIAEFLLLRGFKTKPPSLIIVEAKSSSPHPSRDNFPEYISDIKEKFVNSLTLTWCACLKRHKNRRDLPGAFKSMDLAKIQVKFVLVIKGHRDSWLPPVQEELSKQLYTTIKTWGLLPTSVAVLNEEKAKKFGLILGSP